MISTSRMRHSTLRKVPRGRDDEERLSADMLGAPLPRRLAVADVRGTARRRSGAGS